MATLKNYLTSLEPDMNQTIYSQSIGGYCSTSLLYSETTLTTTIGLYDISITLDTPASGNWSAWQGLEYINIGNEMIHVSPMTNGTVAVVQRGYNGVINMHVATDVVRASSAKQLFNNVFDADHKQYRCIAVRNDHAADTAYNFYVYLKQNSRSADSTIKLSLEQPTSQYITSTSTSWTTMQIVDTSLIGVYSDNYFKEAYLKIISGGGAADQGKIISSFDSATGTFTFYSSFSSIYDYSVNVIYEVLPAPAQRVKTGIVSPSTSSTYVLPFVAASEASPLRFTSGDVSDPAVGDMAPNDVVYIWLERTIEKGVENFDNNDIVLNVGYSESA